MCGRFALYRDPEKTLDLQLLRITPANYSFEPRYNIAPGSPIISLKSARKPLASPGKASQILPEKTATGDPQALLGTMRWGFAPQWLRDLKRAQINARAETIREKPMFRDSFALRRCLIPVDGYFEWRNESGTKKPVYISHRDDSTLLLAGIWTPLKLSDNLYCETCAIITCEATPAMSGIHHRMPLIIPQPKGTDWLDNLEKAAHLLEAANTAQAGELMASRVSQWVNRPGNEGETCIQPAMD